MESQTVKPDIATAEEEMNDAEGSISDIEGDVNKEHRATLEELKKIMSEGRTSDDITFKKLNKKPLKVQRDIVDEAIKYFKSKNQGCKCLGGKAEHRKKNELRQKRRIEGDINRMG